MILLIDKPAGITSFDVIRQLRKKLGIKKIGHAGTLDPMATGLMILATEKDTKKLEQFLKLSKEYETEILLGTKTDSGDVDGEIIEQIQVAELDAKKVKEVLVSMIGTHTFSVPMYSAIKVDGKPLYKYAREGKKPSRIPEKEMTVTDIELLGVEGSVIHARIAVTSGTYIRVLGEEIGKRLGYPATLQALRRTRIAEYSIVDAQKLEDL